MEESKMQHLSGISRTTEWSLLISKATIHYHSNPSLHPNNKCQRSWSWTVLWRPTRLFRTNTPKDVLFIIGDWNAKVGSQETPGVTGKFALGIWNEAGQRLIEFCQENALVIINTLFQQHKRRLYTWASPDGQYRNQTDYSLCSQRLKNLYIISKKKTGSWLWLRSWTPYWQIQTEIEESRENH